MKPIHFCILVLGLLFCFSCSSEDDSTPNEPEPEAVYFPPINSDNWETTAISELNWNESELQPLLDFFQPLVTGFFQPLVIDS